MWTITSANHECGIQVSIPGVADHISEDAQAAIDYSAGSSGSGYGKRNSEMLALQDWDPANCKGNMGLGTQEEHDCPVGAHEPHDRSVGVMDALPTLQSKKGCTLKQPECPHGKFHRCVFWMTNRFCGGQHHGNTTARSRSKLTVRGQRSSKPASTDVTKGNSNGNYKGHGHGRGDDTW